MRERVKTIIAFTVVGIVMIVSIILTMADRKRDVYPNDTTQIMLYGEAHGFREYYDIEFECWQELYGKGCRDLFVELPYYSAEFLNIWMYEDNDELIDQFFEEIQGTQSAVDEYNDFFHEIKSECPGTVFHGTDVGHQNDTTGKRYLRYLEENGLTDSEEYAKALECMRQGDEFHANDDTHTGMSPIRESYMVSNFIRDYTGGTVMGIYGSYHTDLNNPDLMAGQLKSHYGDVMSSVRLSTLAFNKNSNPYRLGICISGLIMLIMLFTPNIIWARSAKQKGYEDFVGNENKVLLMFERIGEAAATVTLVVFPAMNPHIKRLPSGVYFEWTIMLWIMAFVLMIIYECYWIRYFRSNRTMADFYSSYMGFPVAGASLPVIAVFLLGLYSGNLIVIITSIVLGIGHIGIHLVHKKEISE